MLRNESATCHCQNGYLQDASPAMSWSADAFVVLPIE